MEGARTVNCFSILRKILASIGHPIRMEYIPGRISFVHMYAVIVFFSRRLYLLPPLNIYSPSTVAVAYGVAGGQHGSGRFDFANMMGRFPFDAFASFPKNR